MKQLVFNINDGQCEGPLDLVLQLISKHKLNILDINISELLKQYTAQIEEWQKEKIEVSSEFLEMAAKLVYIKSKELLPKYEEEVQKEKDELVGQLLEYKACKYAAFLLSQQSNGFNSFVRQMQKIEKDNTYKVTHKPQEILLAYNDAMGRGKRRLPPRDEVFTPLVVKPVISVSSKIVRLLRQFYHNKNLKFDDAFALNTDKSEMVATFLAILELIKAHRIKMSEDNTEMQFLGRETNTRKEESTGDNIE